MIICRTFNVEFSSYKLLSYRRRQIDLLWKGQRSVDVTKCQHYTTQFWRRKKKLNLSPLVYALLLYFIEELNGGHKEVDIWSLLVNQTVFEYKCLHSVYSCGEAWVWSIKQFILLYMRRSSSPTKIFLSFVPVIFRDQFCLWKKL